MRTIDGDERHALQRARIQRRVGAEEDPRGRPKAPRVALHQGQAEIEEVQETRKEVFAEAKGNGFDVKTLRKVIQARKMDQAKRLEQEAIFDMYMHASGSAAIPETQEDDDPDDVG